MVLTLKTGQAKLWVLLIGVSQYDDRRFPLLQYSTIDTQRLADAFADVTQEFPAISIQVHHDNAAAPTLSGVRSSLQTIVEQAKPEDTVVFYFCGHGALDSRLQQVVLCLADTQKGALLQTGLSVIGLLGQLGNCAAKQQILWMDVCHANGMTPQTETPELLDSPVGHLVEMFQQQANRNPEFQVLLSCDVPAGRRDRAQQSWKFPELGHGIFNHFLIEGLRGAAANPQGIITASVLANFVRDRAIQYVDRVNQEVEWLNRDSPDRASKKISQTPRRVGQAQTQVVLGIKPTDPLELLFPNIKAPNIEPPLDRSASLRKPKPDLITVVPPLVQPPSIEPITEPSQEIEASNSSSYPQGIAPVVEPIVLPAPQSFEPIVEKAMEPIIEPTQEHVEASIPPAVEPIVEKTIEPVALPTINPPIEPTQEHVETSIPLVVEPIVPPIPPIVEPAVPPTVDRVVELSQERVAEPIESTPLQTPKVEATIPQIIQPPPPVPEPVQPAPRKRSKTQRQLKRFRRVTKKRLQQAALSIVQVKHSAGNFAIAQHAHSKEQAAHLHHTLTTKLSDLNQSIHQAANSGQALYRCRTSKVSQLATDTAQHLDRSSRNLARSAIEHAQKPQTRKRINAGLKILGIAAVGATGIGFYQYRNDQIHDVQQLSSAAATQLEANQSALSTALKAGRKLQQVDRPWNFVPESLKISTIATLQQAIAASGEPATTVGVSLSNARLSPDQKTFAVSTRDNSIQLWQRDGDKFQQRGTDLKGHQAAITQLVFSPDGKRLASGSVDKTIKLWDVEKGILIQTLAAHTQAVTALSFRSDGEVLASGSADQTIKLWGVAKGRILDTFKGHNATASVIRFSPDGTVLAAGTLTNTIHLWYPDSQNPILLGSHGSTSEKAQGINDLAFSPDGKTIASAGADSTIKLWTVGNAKAERETVPTQTLSAHENAVTSLSYSADGKILASGGRDRTIRLWNMENGTFLKTLLGSQDAIEQITFSPDGKLLLSVGNRYGLKVWNLDLDSLIQTACRSVSGTTPDQSCF